MSKKNRNGFVEMNKPTEWKNIIEEQVPIVVAPPPAPEPVDLRNEFYQEFYNEFLDLFKVSRDYDEIMAFIILRAMAKPRQFKGVLRQHPEYTRMVVNMDEAIERIAGHAISKGMIDRWFAKLQHRGYGTFEGNDFIFHPSSLG